MFSLKAEAEANIKEGAQGLLFMKSADKRGLILQTPNGTPLMVATSIPGGFSRPLRRLSKSPGRRRTTIAQGSSEVKITFTLSMESSLPRESLKRTRLLHQIQSQLQSSGKP